jgi:hypothetical protein
MRGSRPRGSLVPERPKHMRFVLTVSVLLTVAIAFDTPGQTRHPIKLGDATDRALENRN